MTLVLFISISTQAQIKSVKIIASGLTCSMCSKAIYKSLSKIDIVKDIETDIENSSYLITFKDDSNIDFDILKNAVSDAGFSVASMKVNAHFDNQKISNDSHISYNGFTFHFVNIKDQTLNGYNEITLTDKDFIDSKTYKKNGKFTKHNCYKTGQKEASCPIKQDCCSDKEKCKSEDAKCCTDKKNCNDKAHANTEKDKCCATSNNSSKRIYHITLS